MQTLSVEAVRELQHRSLRCLVFGLQSSHWTQYITNILTYTSMCVCIPLYISLFFANSLGIAVLFINIGSKALHLSIDTLEQRSSQHLNRTRRLHAMAQTTANASPAQLTTRGRNVTPAETCKHRHSLLVEPPKILYAKVWATTCSGRFNSCQNRNLQNKPSTKTKKAVFFFPRQPKNTKTCPHILFVIVISVLVFFFLFLFCLPSTGFSHQGATHLHFCTCSRTHTHTPEFVATHTTTGKSGTHKWTYG